MNKNAFVSFDEYITSKDIQIVNKYKGEPKDIRCLTEREIDEYFKLLSYFHQNAMGFDGYMKKRLDNHTGKLVEECKINIRRLKRDLRKIKTQGPQNVFEDAVLSKGERYVSIAEKSINKAYDSGYMDIILRSMRRIEICIGDLSLNNIYKDNGVKIRKVSDCAYNLIETDCISFLYNIKRKGVNLEWRNLAHNFCHYENLESNSEDFIVSLISFPFEFMKCCNKYREQKKNWSPEKYKERLDKAETIDNISLI